MADDTASGLETDERFLPENLQAEEAIRANNLAEAARILVMIIDKDPSNYRAYNNIGIISWMRKAWEDAYSMFKKSVTLKPGHADALVNLFDAALKLRRVADTLPFFDRALAANPKLDEIRVIRNGIVEQGEGIYTSERGLLVGTYNPRVEEAQALIEEGKLLPAMEKLLKVNDEEGPSADVFSGLGVISYYQQRYNDAFTLFTESIKLNPTSRDDFLNLLDAAKECGRVHEAKDIFDRYSKAFRILDALAPDFAAAAGAALPGN